MAHGKHLMDSTRFYVEWAARTGKENFQKEVVNFINSLYFNSIKVRATEFTALTDLT